MAASRHASELARHFPWLSVRRNRTSGLVRARGKTTAARDAPTNAVVAIIDTGIDCTHPDLAGNLWTNPGEIPGNSADDDGNGYTNDVHGFSFVGGNGDPADFPAGVSNNVALIQRILSNVTPVASLGGKVRTGGRLNLARTVDADANGLPDWWEQQYFSHLTGTNPDADPDGDGMITRYEFYAGTNPSTASSRLEVSQVTWTAADGGFRIMWPCAAGKTYQLQYTDSPAGPWLEDLANSRLTASPGDTALSYTDTTAGFLPHRFYRVRLVFP